MVLAQCARASASKDASDGVKAEIEADLDIETEEVRVTPETTGKTKAYFKAKGAIATTLTGSCSGDRKLISCSVKRGIGF